MIKIEVGRPFPSSNIIEGVAINFEEEGFYLPIGFRNITDKEVHAFKNDKIDIDIAFVNNIIFIVFEIDGVVELSDAAFHIALSTTPLRFLDLNDGEGYKLHMFLIDSNNNELKAIRIIELSNDFSTVLKNLIDKQLDEFFNMQDYEKKLANIFNKMTQQDLKNISLSHFSIK